MRRLFIGLIAGVSAIVSTGIGAGGAAAAPIPNIALYGHNLATMGDHSLCRGTVNLAIHTPQNKRGVVRVTARSLGFGGDGASWKRNPKCRVLFQTTYTSLRGYALHKWVPATFGPRPGEKTEWDVPTGSGPATIGITTYAVNNPVRTPTGGLVGFHMLVP
ncbi:enoyl-CoA hydratase [Gordonia amicalis]|uniref:Enoyl-CoA hydratase n=1 Tax=Gordonia amicalis TaxID=89053 RepID=A0AAE4U559_9ACTN|nr:enoyl-CoA hydratase [Gordonia amicalis]MCZ4579399.1 enoyl-CoA hydratase [Gordonia amicalis]MDV6312150.1 enoyl-CoA hydratase [Gordonia amicalis]UOG20527.1 enoyl-CoA hydratase [Gordonia amicalis]